MGGVSTENFDLESAPAVDEPTSGTLTASENVSVSSNTESETVVFEEGELSSPETDTVEQVTE